MVSFKDRLRHAWNVFTAKNPFSFRNIGTSAGSRPDLSRFSRGNRQSIMSSALNKIAMDCSTIDIKHCRVDENGVYVETINSSLNKILNEEANIDQTGRAFIQDIVISMLDEGHVAVVPIETDSNIFDNGTFGITSMRTGKVKEWFPKHVRVNVYNELKGEREDIILPKTKVAIIQNPLYAVMNEPNSTLQRLIQKMNILDYIDEQSGSGKFNLIFQLPYTLKTQYHKDQAAERKQSIEDQLRNDPYGIAYIDSTERVTQLNRPIENNLLEQIKYLTEMFYNQIGLTKAVFDGTASDAEMLNYYSRTIEPIMAAIANEFKRKFLTKTARTQNQSVLYFRDPFKLIPADKMADIADKFTRNAILSSNELRCIVGYKPVNDERADQLRNANLNEQVGAEPPPSTREGFEEDPYGDNEEYSEEPYMDPQTRIQNALQLPMKSIVGNKQNSKENDST